MAVTAEAEQACFDAFNAAFVADTVNANGLNNSTQSGGAYTSNAFLIGNATGGTAALHRKGDPQRTSNFPRIEWEGFPTEELDTPDHARVQMLVRLHHYTNRNVPEGFDSQNAVVLRSRQVFHRASFSAQGGWNFSTVVRKRGFQAPAAQNEQHYVAEYAVTMSAGSGGGF